MKLRLNLRIENTGKKGENLKKSRRVTGTNRYKCKPWEYGGISGIDDES
jgi:hypothetical protein